MKETATNPAPPPRFQAGGSSAGIPDLNINLQGATNVFTVETPEIIEQIKALLGIPTSGISAQMAAEASVDNFGNLPSQAINPAGSRFIGESATKGDGGAQVIYNTDSGTVYVIGTRQQHEWVEGFLDSADRPQALIGIEVKFFETPAIPKRNSESTGPAPLMAAMASLSGRRPPPPEG